MRPRQWKIGAAVLTKAGLKVIREVMEPRGHAGALDPVGSRGMEGGLDRDGITRAARFDRLILGSVSETVALHAKCSVEVVRMPLAMM